MTLVKEGFIQLTPGETLTGTDVERGVLVNSELEGREAYIEYSSGRRTLVRIMRNTSGAALLPGEICIADVTAGIAGLGQATAKSSAASRLAYVVDPELPTAGVEDNDLFLAFVQGPAKVKAPASAYTPGGDGQLFEAGASGRLQSAAVDGSDSEQIMGTLLVDDTEIPANTLVECVLHPHWD